MANLSGGRHFGSPSLRFLSIISGRFIWLLAFSQGIVQNALYVEPVTGLVKFRTSVPPRTSRCSEPTISCVASKSFSTAHLEAVNFARWSFAPTYFFLVVIWFRFFGVCNYCIPRDDLPIRSGSRPMWPAEKPLRGQGCTPPPHSSWRFHCVLVAEEQILSSSSSSEE